MMGTSFPAVDRHGGTTGTTFPAVDDRHDGHHRGKVDDRHGGTTGGPARHQLARPWPWMMGTTARHDGHHVPAVDRHQLRAVDGHGGTTGDRRGTSLPGRGPG